MLKAGTIISTVAQSEMPSDLLESWKQISAYLQRDVRTVQRWEKREGLPIRRHFHQTACSVYARKSEIEAWRSLRSQACSSSPSEQPESQQRRRRFVFHNMNQIWSRLGTGFATLTNNNIALIVTSVSRRLMGL